MRILFSRRSNAIKIFTFILSACAAFFLMAGVSHAANVTWTATGSGNWSTGSNWSTGAAPGANDIAIFSASSTQNCTIDTSVTVSGIQINAGYTGTITQGVSYSMTIGASGFLQAAGTFTGASPASWMNPVTVNGPFSVTGGTFTSTAGTLTLNGATDTLSSSFQANSGTVIFNTTSTSVTVSGSSTFYDLWFGYASGLGVITISTGTTLTVQASTTISPQYAVITLSGGGTINAQGDVLLAYHYGNGFIPQDTPTLVLSGTGTQTINDGGWAGIDIPFYLPSIVFNKPSGAVNIVGSIGIVGSWTNNNSSSVAMNMGTSTVLFVGSTASITPSATFYNVGLGETIAACQSVALTIPTGTIVTAQGDLMLFTDGTSDALLGGGQINVQGNIDGGYSPYYSTSTAAITLTGTGTQIIGQNLGVNLVNLDLSSLTIAKPSGNITLANSIYLVGSWINNSSSGVTMTPGTSTVTIQDLSTSTIFITGSSTFNNLYLGSAAYGWNGYFSIATGTVITVQGTLGLEASTATDVLLGGGEVDVYGNIGAGYSGQSFTPATSTASLVLMGTSTQVIGVDIGAGINNIILPNLTVNKPYGIAYVALNPIVVGNVTVVSGELQLSTGTAPTSFQVNGTLTVASGATLSNYPTTASSTLLLGSSLTNNGVMFFDGPGVGCGTPLPDLAVIKSTVNGTTSTWSGSGTFLMRYVDVRDQDATAVAGGITDENGYNRSNNFNWTFPTGPRAQLIQPVVTSYTAGTSLTLPPFTLKPRAGDLVVVAVSASNQSLTTSTVTDNASNTYMLVTSSTFGSAPSYTLGIYYAKNITSTSTFTVYVNGVNGSGGPLLTASAFDYTDMSGTSSLDAYSAHIDTTGLATTLTSLSAVANVPGDLYFGALTVATNTTPSASAGWNAESSIMNAANAQSLFIEDMATSTILTTSSQWTSVASTSYTGILALFETPHPGSYAPSGTLDSATFDTQVQGGAQLNSFVWQGTAPSSTAVKFQFAVSNSSSGPWNYLGPSGTGADYFAGNPATPINLVSTSNSNGYALFSGYRYFRYRVTLFSDPQQLYTPNVTQVTVNWSP